MLQWLNTAQCFTFLHSKYFLFSSWYKYEESITRNIATQGNSEKSAVHSELSQLGVQGFH